ncbi:MAG: hypothetical protein AABZ02_09545, partial [Bacteroidota bacterium]
RAVGRRRSTVLTRMSDLALRLENLSKLYRIGPRQRYRTLRLFVAHQARPSEAVQALLKEEAAWGVERRAFYLNFQ